MMKKTMVWAGMLVYMIAFVGETAYAQAVSLLKISENAPCRVQ